MSFLARLKRPFSGLLMGLGIFGSLALALMPAKDLLCGANRAEAATSYPITDFCYQTQIVITNNTGGTLTNYLIPITVNASAFISSGYMSRFADDLLPVNGSTDDVQLMSQDITSSGAHWWMLVSSIPTGNSAYTLYSGSYRAHRDNGVGMNGNAGTYVTTAHNAAFNVTNNFRVTAFAETTASHSTAAWFVSHWTADTGYRLGTITVSGTRYVRAQVDNQTCDVAWDGSLKQIAMDFQTPNLIIAYDGVTQNTCNTGLASVSTNSQAFQSGVTATGTGGFTGTVRNVRLESSYPSAPTAVLYWGFDARNTPTGITLTETQAAASGNSWTAIGTATDTSGNGFTGTYNIVSSQSNITTFVGPTGSSQGTSGLIISQTNPNNILPTPFNSSFVATPVASAGNNLPLGIGTGVNEAATQEAGNRQAVWYITAAILTGFLMVLVGVSMRSDAAVLGVPSLTFLAFAFLGPVSPWIAFALGLAGFGIWRFRRVGDY